MRPAVHPLSPPRLAAFERHMARHFAESGRGEGHFMPYQPGTAHGPGGFDVEALERPLSEPHWQRWFVAVAAPDHVVGHVNLNGDGLHVGLHRCELGIGIERGYRGQGLGQRLMRTAIEFAFAAGSLAWIDLRVFAQNAPARALYESLGFEEIGTVRDRFRIEGTVVDDVLMTMALAP